MRKPLVVSLALALLTLLGLHLSGCVTETVEVTRVKIMERHVIERVPITVEVTRIQRVVETPRPSPIDVLPPDDTETPQASSETPSASPTPTRPSPTPGTPAPTEPSANQSGRAILAALQNVEQTLLVLVGALNSEPPPVDQTIELYDSLRDAPRVDVPEAETELSSINDRYREQID
ncbi:MAG: hypothetical protein GTO41_05180, partial [Burkholderiales bacterium]|nr:hypothetical protein [Burkholderiales bacterium]